MSELKLVGYAGLFRSHDMVNMVVFAFVLALLYLSANLLVQDWAFIVMMSVIVGALSASMLFKQPIF